MDDLNKILREYWGFDSFRPLQEDIMRSILSGKDTLALMPTGGGKSLCYQVPAMAKPGLCLVVSPLIALMKDQVENLRRKNITAYSIYSGMSRRDVVHTLKTVINSNCKFLYVSPERLETTLFREFLPGMDINLLAVDEAHCISQWGYDFRPPYLRIAALREELPGVPVLALTASATPEVQDDICERLTVPGRSGSLVKPVDSSWNIFRQSFERPNLSYSAFRVDSRINKIIDILSKVPGCAIIYCKSRKRTQEISELLRMHDIPADFYHAGLSQEDRNRKQEEWLRDQTRVIVCTNAFGMGIDKPDVRVVIHADVPDCLENYYQEAGRAGRDGKRSYAVLLYDEKELEDLDRLPALRYPSINDIREVYQAAANYLQIPAGGGEGEYHDFDITDFVKKFKLNVPTVVYSLKALEQEDWLSFNEQVFLPATARFVTTKNRLYEFEKAYPALEALIKSLLRAYEGIFDYPVSISELQLAKLLRVDVEKVKAGLLELSRHGILEYEPQKDKPQLVFLRDRARAEAVSVNQQQYESRKANFIKRVREMSRFVVEEEKCRSQWIGRYFGDVQIGECGICDNCLRRKPSPLTQEEFDRIHHTILTSLKARPLQTRELIRELVPVSKEKAWKVIEFLQAENKIVIDKNGRVNLAAG